MAKITAIDKIGAIEFATLEQQVQDKCLCLDIWERNGKQYQQIFIQINNVKIKSVKKELIKFTISDEIRNKLRIIETKLCNVLTTFFATKLKKEENIKMTPLSTKNCLALDRAYDDYDTLFYNKDKEQTTTLDTESIFNIIVEIMRVKLDMTKNVAAPDIRLRMVLENKPLVPNRIKLSDVDAFLLVNEEESPNPNLQQTQMSQCCNIENIDTDDTDDAHIQSYDKINNDIENTLHKIEESDAITDISENEDVSINISALPMMYAMTDMLKGIKLHQTMRKNAKVTECDN